MTETKDGQPASTLMGKFREYDGGETAFVFNPFSFILAHNDFALMFRFTPRTPLTTDMEINWLVDEGAVAGKDYEVDNITWLWDVTSRQDKKITEDNQKGVLSSRYQPGPYSQHERKVITLDQWYLNQLRAAVN